MNWIKPDWPAPVHVHAATTLRSGGNSQHHHASNNLALHVNDEPAHVLLNREKLRQNLRLPSEPVWLQQVHGTGVVKADQVMQTPKADAAYTDQPDTVCVIMTADCLPILMTSGDGQVIAAAHAGWRGLLAGIIEQTVAMMNCRDTLVWLGPAIGPKCFEVGIEVREAYLHKSNKFIPAFKQINEHKWLADIYSLAKITLASLDINHIYGGNFCTVSDSERFFSYRRDGETGRMASLIWRS